MIDPNRQPSTSDPAFLGWMRPSSWQLEVTYMGRCFISSPKMRQLWQLSSELSLVCFPPCRLWVLLLSMCCYPLTSIDFQQTVDGPWMLSKLQACQPCSRTFEAANIGKGLVKVSLVVSTRDRFLLQTSEALFRGLLLP